MTPMVSFDHRAGQLLCKVEGQNPTGSFKDRGSSILVSMLARAGVTRVCEDSSGNAGASLAAYCAKAGIDITLFVPHHAAENKLSQAHAHGGTVVRIEGPRQACTEAANRTSSQEGCVYASHVLNPLSIAGIATCAFEIWEQLGGAPDAIVAPLGQGTMLLGLFWGFRVLQRRAW